MITAELRLAAATVAVSILDRGTVALELADLDGAAVLSLHLGLQELQEVLDQGQALLKVLENQQDASP